MEGKLANGMGSQPLHTTSVHHQRAKRSPTTGNWNMASSKDDLITKYKKEFCAFIETIGFDDLKL